MDYNALMFKQLIVNCTISVVRPFRKFSNSSAPKVKKDKVKKVGYGNYVNDEFTIWENCFPSSD
jgi:hypothetical protein